jgi:hypothetical protein
MLLGRAHEVIIALQNAICDVEVHGSRVAIIPRKSSWLLVGS